MGEPERFRITGISLWLSTKLKTRNRINENRLCAGCSVSMPASISNARSSQWNAVVPLSDEADVGIRRSIRLGTRGCCRDGTAGDAVARIIATARSQ